MARVAECDTAVHRLSHGGNGNLGYFDNGKLIPLFGPLCLGSKVPRTTVENNRAFAVGLDHGPVNANMQRGRGIQHVVQNILFTYEDTPGGPVVYLETPWEDDAQVRALYSSALAGSGAIFASNQYRVFVLDRSLPHVDQGVRRGFLKVQVGEIETFLQRIMWAGRSEGYLRSMAYSGEKVQTFVINDSTHHQAYYVAGAISPWNNHDLLCRLQKFGKVRNWLHWIVPRRKRRDVGEWAKDAYGVSSVLFD